MKLEIIEPIDKVGFYDRWGKYRSTQGCSLIGLGEFKRWLEILVDLVGKYSESHKTLTYAELYQQSIEGDDVSPILATACDRLLELNGIDPEWVTPAMLGKLLFNHLDEQGQPKPGLLIALNYPNRVAEPNQQSEDINAVANAIATLTKVTEGLQEALDIANSEPWKPVSEVLNAIAEQQKKENPESPGQTPKRKLSPDEIREKIAKMTAIPQ